MNAAESELKLDAVALERGLPPRGSGIVAAVSGGRDSMVLLRWLDARRASMHWRIVVAHYHHQLRGADADQDQALVARVAEASGLKFVPGTGDVSGLRRRDESWESAARRLRHEFLAGVARDHDCGWVATGHHGSDQAELFLLRLLRGAGSSGLSGMNMVDPSPVEPSVRLVRPLLGLSGEEVAELARAWGVEFRADASNSDPAHLRNRVRHELIPLLRERFQPALERVLEREQTLLRDQSAVIVAWAEAWLDGSERGADLQSFDELAVALQREVLRVQLERRGVAADFEWIESLRLRVDEPVQIEPRCRIVRRPTGRVEWLGAGSGPGPFQGEACVVPFDRKEGRIEFGGGALVWEMAERDAGFCVLPAGEGAEMFDAESVGECCRLRFWRPGDRFQPIGLGTPAKLQDLFTNARIPAGERRRRVVAETSGGELFWVDGLRIGECAKVRPSTVRRLRWRWRGSALAVAED